MGNNLKKKEETKSYHQGWSDRDWSDRDYVLTEVRKNGLNIKHASYELRNDKEIFLEAMKTSGSSLHCGSKEFKDDFEIVLAAVRQCGSALASASDRLKNNRDIVLEAVRQDAHSVLHASDELRNAKKVFIEAMKQNGESLQFGSEEFKNDYDIVLAAVRQSGISLTFASDQMKNNREIVLEAVKQNGRSIEIANEELRNCGEIAFEACFQSRRSFEYLGDKLRKDSPLLDRICELEGDIEVALNDYPLSEFKNDSWKDRILKILQKSELELNWFKFKNPPDLEFERLIKEEEKEIKKLSDALENVHFQDIEILKFLGRGAFGGTYLCSVEGILGNFVMKIYNDPRLGKTKKEEYISKDGLKFPYHPNVVSVLSHKLKERIDTRKFPDYEDFWKEVLGKKKVIKGKGMLLFRYQRDTLDSFVKKRSTKESVDSIALMIYGLVNGVCHLHDNMIVHRDLHTKNIFVDPENGRIRIGDFGCALDLRNNPTKFIVGKDEAIMFCFTTNTYFMKVHDPESGFVRGGYTGGMAPEIKSFDPLKEDFLNYGKCDLYPIGKISQILVDVEKVYSTGGSYEDIYRKLVKLSKDLSEVDFEKRIGFNDAKKVMEEIMFSIKKIIERSRNGPSFSGNRGYLDDDFEKKKSERKVTFDNKK